YRDGIYHQDYQTSNFVKPILARAVPAVEPCRPPHTQSKLGKVVHLPCVPTTYNGLRVHTGMVYTIRTTRPATLLSLTLHAQVDQIGRAARRTDRKNRAKPCTCRVAPQSITDCACRPG